MVALTEDKALALTLEHEEWFYDQLCDAECIVYLNPQDLEDTGIPIEYGCGVRDGKSTRLLFHAKQPLAASPKWLPIETAPRDGTEILAVTSGGVRIVWWFDDYWHDHSMAMASYAVPPFKPTHWMPLPEAPVG